MEEKLAIDVLRRNQGSPDALTSCQYLQEALVVVVKFGYTDALAHAEKMAYRAVTRRYRTKYYWCRMALILREAGPRAEARLKF